MKRILLSLPVLLLLATGCRKAGAKPGMLEGKVLRISCASFVVQVLNNKNIGQDNWLDVTNNKTYHDVIAADNVCDLPGKAIEGKIIRFDTDTANSVGTCAICDMYDAPPTVRYTLKNVSVKN